MNLDSSSWVDAGSSESSLTISERELLKELEREVRNYLVAKISCGRLSLIT